MMRIPVTAKDAKRGYKVIRVVISGYWNARNEESLDKRPGNKSVTKHR